jgi:AraC-like DNA-binding protein
MNGEKNTLKVVVLQKSGAEAFSQSENGICHTSYADEKTFYGYVGSGDTENVAKMLESFTRSGIVAGRLSEDPTRQMKYFAVCCITLGTRYAIAGGLDENRAFSFSDGYIRKIDRLETENEIAAFLARAVTEITALVKTNRNAAYPKPVRVCAAYIEKHLHEKISLGNLASVTGLNADYLAKIFKKATGETPREYILRVKLEEAKKMLDEPYDQNMIGYYLGFCSQTYFITRFKRAFGVTPHKYSQHIG